jgi:hypothetical protein
MARVWLLLALLGVGYLVANDGWALREGLEDKLILIALLPGVYILGLVLLRD